MYIKVIVSPFLPMCCNLNSDDNIPGLFLFQAMSPQPAVYAFTWKAQDNLCQIPFWWHHCPGYKYIPRVHELGTFMEHVAIAKPALEAAVATWVWQVWSQRHSPQVFPHSSRGSYSLVSNPCLVYSGTFAHIASLQSLQSYSHIFPSVSFSFSLACFTVYCTLQISIQCPGSFSLSRQFFLLFYFYFLFVLLSHQPQFLLSPLHPVPSSSPLPQIHCSSVSLQKKAGLTGYQSKME